MKIGFVATEIGHQEGGAFMGGNVNNVVTVSKALAERGHEITIITTKPRDAAEDYLGPLTWADVYSIDCPHEHGSPRYLTTFSRYAVQRIRQLANDGELDVVSVHTGFTIWGIIGSLSSVLGCPSVHVQYCPIGQSSGSTVYDLIQSVHLSKLWLRGNDRFVGVTDNVARSLSSATRDRVDVIHNGLDVDEYAPEADSRFDLFETDSPVIGYLGSLNDQKGLDILVDAFQSLPEERDATLALGLEVRSERSESELWKRIERDPDIHAFGIVQDVPAFLARSDVFAVPFRTTVGPADYPVAALEAMSCATPPVATRIGGLPDMIAHQEDGLLIDRPDSELLAESLATLLDDAELRRELGQSARERIERDFSTTSVVDQYEAVFTEVVGQ
ncbi:glycosyltransferase family 4 protein [Natronolimnohabitans innermongolicus]|uniref:Group 1 glycosyl transferase n=1 Tax=Natronolimnohabitans innermongolicus JCM 12255 TaxID=1227499 RepID=L9XHD6_9EURY|nr:glycosyltransferase family 4 protein [Natronolimnohabitans innermongolicus]ELY61125.1 group 1 glycosyl transferase [Natronolimnohabitans innermongolicus JCM 12255]